MNISYAHYQFLVVGGLCYIVRKVRPKPSFLNLTVSKKNAIKQIKLLAQILLSCISKKNRLLKKKNVCGKM